MCVSLILSGTVRRIFVEPTFFFLFSLAEVCLGCLLPEILCDTLVFLARVKEMGVKVDTR